MLRMMTGILAFLLTLLATEGFSQIDTNRRYVKPNAADEYQKASTRQQHKAVEERENAAWQVYGFNRKTVVKRKGMSLKPCQRC